VYVNKNPYYFKRCKAGVYIGGWLREILKVDDDKDLWLSTRRPGDDIIIEPGSIYSIQMGAYLYTTRKEICGG
jgi:hypothetical protein